MIKKRSFQIVCNVAGRTGNNNIRYCHSKLPVVTLYSKAEKCSLCDDAKIALYKHQEKFVLKEVDITSKDNESLFQLYRYHIPVVHVNGKEIMRYKVFEKVLLDALSCAKK